MSAPQDSRTAAIFTSAALHGSVKPWKCAFTHSLLLGGTSLRHVPAARLYDRNILSKSRGYREQDKYCKNQIRPCHGSLQSFEHSANAGHLTARRARRCAVVLRKVSRDLPTHCGGKRGV